MDSSVPLTHHPESWLEECIDEQQTSNDEFETGNDVIETEEQIKPKFTPKSSNGHEGRGHGKKPHSTPLTLKWLEENYERVEGVCIPRSTLYVHYVDFCCRMATHPINAASFGKIIRQQFPHLTTRRLGTRGQSKYHYYGIGVRESSVYYDVIYSSKGVDKNADSRKEFSKQSVTYSPRSKLGTLLPDFPDISDIVLPMSVSPEKVETFLLMYRAHCQRILDTVIRANFDEVENFLVHFWQGIPAHLTTILTCETVANLVGVCDSILYKVIVSVLMPAVLQPLPDSLTQVIRKFAKKLDAWLDVALQGLPPQLCDIKYDLARRFAQVMRRQTCLNQLCVAAASVTYNLDLTSQMLHDWGRIDQASIVQQTLYTMDHYSLAQHDAIAKLCQEFEKLLESQASIECYTDWLESLVDRCVVQVSQETGASLRRVARQFLLIWSCFGTRVIRDMTLYSAPSFGSFHLLHLMFDDYIMYLVETLYSQERANELLRCIKGEHCVSQTEDSVLPKPNLSHFPSTAMSCMHGEGRVERNTVITSTRSQSGNDCSDPKARISSVPPSSPNLAAPPLFSSADVFTDRPDCSYTRRPDTASRTCSVSECGYSRQEICQTICEPTAPYIHYPSNSPPCAYEEINGGTYMAEWTAVDNDTIPIVTQTEFPPCNTHPYTPPYNYSPQRYIQCDRPAVTPCQYSCMKTVAESGGNSPTLRRGNEPTVRLYAGANSGAINRDKRHADCGGESDYNQNVIKCAKYDSTDMSFRDCLHNGFVC